MTYEEARRITDGWDGQIDLTAELLRVVNAAVFADRQGPEGAGDVVVAAGPRMLYALVDDDNGEIIDFQTVDLGQVGSGFVRVGYIRLDLHERAVASLKATMP